MFALPATLTACTVLLVSLTTVPLALLEPISTPPTVLAPTAPSRASHAALLLSVPLALQDIPSAFQVFVLRLPPTLLAVIIAEPVFRLVLVPTPCVSTVWLALCWPMDSVFSALLLAVSALSTRTLSLAISPPALLAMSETSSISKVSPANLAQPDAVHASTPPFASLAFKDTLSLPSTVVS